jgi:SAM-dependent methyltransferase
MAKAIKSPKQYLAFLNDYRAFTKASRQSNRRFRFAWKDRMPRLGEKNAVAGFDRHYVYHTAWAARIIARLKPAMHVDISSSLYFVSIISAFVPVRFFDFTPPDLHLDNCSIEKGDITALPFGDNSVQSLSSMHVIEHIGLGRYGDPIDPDGDVKAVNELCRVIAPDGSLLFVVPVGRERIRFNAHRIYSYEMVLRMFESLELKEFSYIADSPGSGGIRTGLSQQECASLEDGCGCFWFVKRR